MDFHEDTALLIDRMCAYVERQDFKLDKPKAEEAILKTNDLFDLPRPKKIEWCVDPFTKKFQRSARSAGSAGSARSAWSARSARSAGSARSAWSAWSARSAWSAWSARSAWSAGSAWSARSADWTALDFEFYWFVVEYEYILNPDKEYPVNDNDLKYRDYSLLLLEALEAGVGYRVEWEDILYIAPTPLVKIDELNRFHSLDFPAIRWKGGKEVYFLRGENFDKELWTKIATQKITAKEVMQIDNSDKRTIARSLLGPKEMHKQLGGKLIHTGKKGTKLYECKNFEGTGDTEYYMTMIDSSTPREFLEFVPPEVGKHKNADLAQANAFGIPLEDYLLMEQEA